MLLTHQSSFMNMMLEYLELTDNSFNLFYFSYHYTLSGFHVIQINSDARCKIEWFIIKLTIIVAFSKIFSIFRIYFAFQKKTNHTSERSILELVRCP